MPPCLIMVSRDGPELLAAPVVPYGHEAGVEIRFDGRQGLPWTAAGDTPHRRAPPNPDTDMKDHGFIVIPRPSLGGASH